MYHEMKGLQLQIAARTPKLKKLPRANPPTSEKLATVAAISTSSNRPFNLRLCSTDGAAIMHRLEM
jgi:hypothetical protein